MRKMVMIQMLKGKKTRTAVKELKPLEIYDIATDTHEPLYNGEERRVFKSSGYFGNLEVSEFENKFGVTLRKVKQSI